MVHSVPINRSGLSVLLVCALSVFSGCSDSSTQAGGSLENVDASTNLVLDPSDAEPTQTDVTVTEPGDVPVEQETEEPPAPDVPPAPVLGQIDEPCESPEECDSGWCVPGPDGTVCTKNCDSACPEGWACQTVQGSGGDPISLCINLTAQLCHPCQGPSDCNYGGGDGPNRCVDWGDEGSFCGLLCGDQGYDCPEGYVCQDGSAPEGEVAPTPQCVPADDAICECNGLAKLLGMKTACSLTNEWGACGGLRGCSASGLGPCDAPPANEETCNDLDDDCDGVTDDGLKDTPCELINDHGTCPGITACQAGGSVCTGVEAKAELCDELDDDCDGLVDEGWPDTDNDLVLDCFDDDDDADGIADQWDCDPLDPTVYPAAVEYCNGKDDDCDGTIDEVGSEGCELYYRDVDQDQYGEDDSPPMCLCQSLPSAYYTAHEGGDCDDLKPTVYPGAPEACNGLDDDCDGLIDEDTDGDLDQDGIPNCVDEDDDGDGFNDIEDCNPLNPSVYPGAQEKCNLVDDDCDNYVDEEGAQGCIDLWPDVDGDKQGDADEPMKCLCGVDVFSSYSVANHSDCNDLDPAIFVGAPELCNGIDDDCDEEVDEGTGGDTDGDGILDCTDPDDDNDGALDPDDCSPLDAGIFPGAQEVCNGHDDNCNGHADEEGAAGCSPYHRDADGDGYGTTAVPPQCLCGPNLQTLFTAPAPGDCNDNNADISPGVDEICNFIDDNCNEDIDEGVGSPCGGCQPVCVIDTGEGADEGFDEQGEQSSGVAETDDGGLTLVSNSFAFPFIWVANSGEHTLSKVNTDTGCEAARYYICNNPSRTAVDLDGNGIVTCRGDGHAAKIAVLEPDCIDKNNNGAVDTSRDTNGDCVISGNEMVGNDECVLWNVKPDPGENTTRAAGVDKDNHVWVGTWNTKKLMRLNSETGAVMTTHNISARPYGLAIDGDGHMWVASRDPAGRLVEVHPTDGELYATTHPSGQGYGIAVDPLGKVWMASGEPSTVARFDPVTNQWTNFSLSAPGYTRGVAVRRVDDNNGNLIGAQVFVAHHSWSGCNNNGHHRKVTVIDALSLQELPDIDIGADRAPVGVAVDSLGFLWTVNQCHSSATKINPDTYEVVGTYPVGSSPYTYSDMTGYALKTITTSQGFYTEIYNGWAGSQTLWHQILVDVDLPGDGLTWITLEYRLADTEAGLAAEAWQGPLGPFPPALFPVDFGEVGNHLEIKVTMGTDDNLLKPTLHSVTLVAFELDE